MAVLRKRRGVGHETQRKRYSAEIKANLSSCIVCHLFTNDQRLPIRGKQPSLLSAGLFDQAFLCQGVSSSRGAARLPAQAANYAAAALGWGLSTPALNWHALVPM